MSARAAIQMPERTSARISPATCHSSPSPAPSIAPSRNPVNGLTRNCMSLGGSATTRSVTGTAAGSLLALDFTTTFERCGAGPMLSPPVSAVTTTSAGAPSNVRGSTRSQESRPATSPNRCPRPCPLPNTSSLEAFWPWRMKPRSTRAGFVVSCGRSTSPVPMRNSSSAARISPFGCRTTSRARAARCRLPSSSSHSASVPSRRYWIPSWGTRSMCATASRTVRTDAPVRNAPPDRKTNGLRVVCDAVSWRSRRPRPSCSRTPSSSSPWVPASSSIARSSSSTTSASGSPDRAAGSATCQLTGSAAQSRTASSTATGGRRRGNSSRRNRATASRITFGWSMAPLASSPSPSGSSAAWITNRPLRPTTAAAVRWP